MQISIIILHYKTPYLLHRCVKSIVNSNTRLNYEIIIVDNDSQDNSKQLILKSFTDTIWIDAGYNSGFARGNNLGIRQAKGDYILLLNSDTIVQENFLDEFLTFYKDNDKNDQLGLLGCRIIGVENGNLLVGTGVGFRGLRTIIRANPIYLFFTRRKRTKTEYIPKIMHYQNHEVDFVSGCCVMTKRSKVLEKELFLDEDFFLYSEDVEWSYRIKKKGFVNYFCGELEILHENGASSESNQKQKAQIQISEYLYYLKTNSKFNYNVLGALLNINFRLDLFLNRKRKDSPEIRAVAERFDIYKRYFKKIKSYRHKKRDFLKYEKQN